MHTCVVDPQNWILRVPLDYAACYVWAIGSCEHLNVPCVLVVAVRVCVICTISGLDCAAVHIHRSQDQQYQSHAAQKGDTEPVVKSLGVC